MTEDGSRHIEVTAKLVKVTSGLANKTLVRAASWLYLPGVI